MQRSCLTGTLPQLTTQPSNSLKTSVAYKWMKGFNKDVNKVFIVKENARIRIIIVIGLIKRDK